MTFKNYLKLLVHVIITALIILTLPIIVCVVLHNNIPDWVVSVCGVVTGLFTIYPAIKYIDWASRGVLT